MVQEIQLYLHSINAKVILESVLLCLKDEYPLARKRPLLSQALTNDFRAELGKKENKCPLNYTLKVRLIQRDTRELNCRVRVSVFSSTTTFHLT